MVGIVKYQSDFRHIERTAVSGTGKDDIAHLFASHLTAALLSEYPSHCISNIGFSASVGSYDTGDRMLKRNNGFVGKRFESLHFDPF